MIVRHTEDRLQLITQPDHAQLAARIMEHCVPLSQNKRRDDIVLAIREHDNGWAETDAAPSVDPATGRIFDFVAVPVELRQAVWPRGIARLGDRPWAAALVAHHAWTVYQRYRGDPDWTGFFAAMVVLRDAMLDQADQPLARLEMDYVYLRMADLISLTFCTGWTDEQRFDQWRVAGTGPHVTVSPDLFGRAEIPMDVEMREIANRSYASDADLGSALRAAETVTLRGSVIGA